MEILGCNCLRSRSLYDFLMGGVKVGNTKLILNPKFIFIAYPTTLRLIIFGGQYEVNFKYKIFFSLPTLPFLVIPLVLPSDRRL